MNSIEDSTSNLAVAQRGKYFVDDSGRQVLLRGVNLGGDCKVPFPNGGTQFPSDFSDHRAVSFIGRPFPLEEATEHFSRLRYWGFNCIRLLTTWEAVEHNGPNQYDQAYVDYFTEICSRAGEFGLTVFVDFHQDVWSRMTGGDGAPGWLFDAVGLDFTRFDAADCAHVMQYKYNYNSDVALQAEYPQMSWGSNYRLPANGIMWTLFWGGKLLTPDFLIEGRNVQDFLQGYYLGAMQQLAQPLSRLPHVIGFDTLNEPGIGWLGEKLSYRHIKPSTENPSRPRIGPALSPLDSLAIARGIPTTVPVLTRNPETGAAEVTSERTLNEKGICIWKDNKECPFAKAGAYAIKNNEVVALNEDFFKQTDTQKIEVSQTGYGPFFNKVADVIRKVNPNWSLFAEMDPFGATAGRRFPKPMPTNSVNASHWYDVTTLYLKTFDLNKHFDFHTGNKESDVDTIRARYVRQLQAVKDRANDFNEDAPTLIGEFGIPYDLDHGQAYKAWRDGERDTVWAKHELALELMYDALDTLLLHSTQWNYTAANRNDLRIGDNWNQEDLSIFSRDQQLNDDIGSGGRAVEGFCRPYVQRCQGHLESMEFDTRRKIFSCGYIADPAIDAPTVIYYPKIQFPQGIKVRVEGGASEVEIADDQQLLHIKSRVGEKVAVTITCKMSP